MANINQIPYEIRLRIANYLTSADIRQLMLVHSRWRDAFIGLQYRNLVLTGGRPMVPLLRIIEFVGMHVQILTIQHSRGHLIPLRGEVESRFFIECCPNIQTINVTDANPYYILKTIVATPLPNLRCINIDWDRRHTFSVRRHYMIATLKHRETITDLFLPYPAAYPFVVVIDSRLANKEQYLGSFPNLQRVFYTVAVRFR